MALDAFLTQAAGALGAANVLRDPALLSALATPDFAPSGLCRPGSIEELAALVRLAAEARVPLVPCGGFTAMSLGARAPKDAVAVSLQRLDQMVAYEPSDLVATAQAGMSFGAFDETLFEHGQCLPLDAPGTSTLGGLCATNRSGPRRFLYGTLRDHVLGLTYVTGDGVIRKCGGRVVKNVTGYALEKLQLGALGTLGILAEVTVKLRPRAETQSVQELSAPDFDAGFAAVRELAARLPFSAVAVTFPGKPFSAQFGIEASPPDHARLLRELEDAAAALGGELHETGALEVDADFFPAQPRRLQALELPGGQLFSPVLAARLSWSARPGDFLEQARKLDVLAGDAGFGFFMGFFEFPAHFVAELYFPQGFSPKSASAVLRAVKPAAALPAVGSTTSAAGPSTNATDAASSGAAPAPSRSNVVAAVTPATGAPNIDLVLRELRASGCAVSVLWRAPNLALAEPVFGPPRAEWDWMRKLKTEFDPHRILNPNRFITGI